MAEGSTAADLSQANLNLTSEEKLAYGQLFQEADTERLGVVTGDVAVKFFERTRLDSTVLGEIWQIADTENRGLLTPVGFSIVLRLIGHCQAGMDATPEIALRPGPLPRFEDLRTPASPPAPASPTTAIQPQISGPIRVPPLTLDKINQYASLFERVGAQDGLLAGDAAKQFFERARLPNETLGRIWTLSDTEQRGALGVTQFIIAMHLLASMRSGALRALPQSLPPGLYEAASRRGAQPPLAASIPRQFSGAGVQRTASPLSRAPYNASPQAFRTNPMTVQPSGNDWLITPQEKAKYDQVFATVDKTGAGSITGDEAVQFFSNSGLSEEVLASIWDLADINSEGRLNADEFAVAMYLIRQQRARKDGRGDLPPTLPPALVPPNMRQRSIAPQQPTAPAFDNAAFATQQPKSAADDLFGLDALSSDPTPSRQSTAPLSTEPDPFSGPTPVSPPPARGFVSPSRSPPSSFKPFVPTSSFGQGLASQTTGGSVQSSGSADRGISQTQRSVADDLLGDNDADSNSKITQDSTELANMSNQIGILRTQMQGVQAKRSTAEVNLSQTNKQKADLELRLSQFRSQYEQEVQTVKTLEEQLNASRSETKKMQQEFAMVDGAFKDLKNQHATAASALESDQRENATLKERIRQMNAEIAELRPQLEKLKSEARQQRGLVAINKKQLSTNEAERDKIQSDIQDIEAQNVESARSRAAVADQAPSFTASPALSPSSQSTNPFFRSPTSQPFSNPMSPSGFALESESAGEQNAFDSVFGSSQATPQSMGPPPTTFRSIDEQQTSSVREAGPVTSLPASPRDQVPPALSEPPPPPEPRQITSSALPLRRSLASTDSLSSSVKANPATSHYEDSRAGTPTPLSLFPTPSQSRDISSVHDGSGSTSSPAFPDSQTLSQTISQHPEPEEQLSESETHSVPAKLPQTQDEPTDTIPGAFPEDVSTPVASTATGESSESAKPEEVSRAVHSNPFSGSEEVNAAPSASKDDFESNFTGFNEDQQSEVNRSLSLEPGFPSAVTNASKSANPEFPPIQDLNEEDSDSDSEPGFEDNFTAASPQRNNPSTTQVQSQLTPSTGAESQVDDLSTSRVLMPQEDAKRPQSPKERGPVSSPVYDQAVNSTSNGDTRELKQYSTQFGGLLPSPAVSGSPHEAAQASQPGFLASKLGAKQQLSDMNGSSPAPVVPTDSVDTDKAAVEGDDFDAAFDDLSEAKEVDEQAPDDFGVVNGAQAEHEFDPTFDSPAPSKSTPFDFQQTPTGNPGSRQLAASSFDDFAPTIGGATQSFYSTNAPKSNDAGTDDWDAIFSGLDDSREAGINSNDPFHAHTAQESVAPSEPSSSSALQRPAAPGRALTGGTEHDDPILQRLTGMGYGRTAALSALEKYDYNIEKAADYLTSRS